jgi:hypothetical protein
MRAFVNLDCGCLWKNLGGWNDTQLYDLDDFDDDHPHLYLCIHTSLLFLVCGLGFYSLHVLHEFSLFLLSCTTTHHHSHY